MGFCELYTCKVERNRKETLGTLISDIFRNLRYLICQHAFGGHYSPFPLIAQEDKFLRPSTVPTTMAANPAAMTSPAIP